MNLSNELQCLILCIRIALSETPPNYLLLFFKKNKINWSKLERLAIYHKIRPLIHDAFGKVNIENEFSQKMKHFSKIQATKNVTDYQEIIRVLQLLRTNNVPALPYKGILFLHEIYNSKPLRESNDLDILIPPQFALTALQLLIKDGYHLSITPTIPINQELLDTFLSRELGLDKKVIISFSH